MDNLQNELNKDWLDMVLTKSLDQWNTSKKNETNGTVEEFVEFTKEVAEIYFMD